MAVWASCIAIKTLQNISKQTKASIRAARTANTSFKMSMTGYLGIKDAGVTLVLDGGRSGLIVSYKLFNASPVPVRLLSTTTSYSIAGGPDVEASTINFDAPETLPPTKGFHVPIDTGPLTHEHLAAYNERRLIVSVSLEGTITDPLDRQSTHVFKRLVRCGPGLVQSTLWDGSTDSE